MGDWAGVEWGEGAGDEGCLEEDEYRLGQVENGCKAVLMMPEYSNFAGQGGDADGDVDPWALEMVGAAGAAGAAGLAGSAWEWIGFEGTELGEQHASGSASRMDEGVGGGVGRGGAGGRDGKMWLIEDAWFMEYAQRHMLIEPAQLKQTALARCLNPKR